MMDDGSLSCATAPTECADLASVIRLPSFPDAETPEHALQHVFHIHRAGEVLERRDGRPQMRRRDRRGQRVLPPRIDELLDFRARLFEGLGLPDGADPSVVFSTKTVAEWEQWARERDVPLACVRA